MVTHRRVRPPPKAFGRRIVAFAVLAFRPARRASSTRRRRIALSESDQANRPCEERLA